MKLRYVPLLKVQRELYRLPRSRERFEAYLRHIVDARTGDLALPLSGMNPMAHEHIPAFLDALLAVDADGAAERALAQEALNADLADGSDEFRVTLVVADDVRGQWTNRFTAEFDQRFRPQAMMRRGWLAGTLWASEPATAQTAAREVRLQVHRAGYLLKHGEARTLREMLAQEGAVMKRAGVKMSEFGLSEQALADAQRVIGPHLASDALPEVMTCLFGDVAAESLGYEPLGLPMHAGFAVALASE